MSEDFFTIGTDVFLCEESGKKCTVKVGISKQTTQNCNCHIVFQGADDTFAKIVSGENWYQAMLIAGVFIRRYLAEHYSGYRHDDGEGATSSVHYIYPRFVDPYYGADVYDDICNYMDKKVKAIEDDRTRRFGTHDDGRSEN